MNFRHLPRSAAPASPDAPATLPEPSCRAWHAARRSLRAPERTPGFKVTQGRRPRSAAMPRIRTCTETIDRAAQTATPRSHSRKPSMSTSKSALTTHSAAETPAPGKYQNARGCLIMLAIVMLALGGMVLLMYFLGDHPVPPPAN
jgi:hypothetical protein